MSQLLNSVITVGILDLGGGTVIYGYNSAGIGSISPTATQANGPVVAVCQWNSSNQSLQLNYTTSSGNAGFERIVIGTTSFYRTDATFTAGSPDRWNWNTATNPFGTVAEDTRNFDIFGEIYGLQVYDADGTTTVLSPATRFTNVMAIETVNVAHPNTQLIECDMTETTISNSGLLFATTTSFDFQDFVTRESGGFRITPPSGQTITGTAWAVRF